MRVARLNEWQKIIDEYMPNHDVAEIVERAAALRIPVSPVHDRRDAAVERARRGARLLLRDDDGVLRPRPPYRIDDDPVPAPQRAPRLGEHEGDVEPSTRPAPTSPADDRARAATGGLEGARPHLVVGRLVVDAAHSRCWAPR